MATIGRCAISRTSGPPAMGFAAAVCASVVRLEAYGEVSRFSSLLVWGEDLEVPCITLVLCCVKNRLTRC